MRIAVVFEENIFDRKGAFNAKCARIRHLEKVSGWTIDVFCAQLYQDAFVSSILGRRSVYIPGEGEVLEKRVRKRDCVTLNGVRLNLLWKNYSILDHFLFYKLNVRPVCYPRFIKDKAAVLKEYDVVAAHSFVGGAIALEAKRRYGIPFYISWHGSDIHTTPFRHPQIRQLTSELIREAEVNCFVSRALLEKSEEIGHGVKTVLYNGCDEMFVRYDEQRRMELRKRFNVEEMKVVAYAGNMLPVKNVASLPEIFRKVREKARGQIEFWVVGDGPLRSAVEAEMSSDLSVPCRFWGNILPGMMPEIFNCTDVLVLPSLNEGLPLVIAEALRCGSKVVASRVGGIPEILGSDYTVSLGEDFSDRISDKIVECLSFDSQRIDLGKFDWDATARREMELVERIYENG